MKSQDIFILLKLISLEQQASLYKFGKENDDSPDGQNWKIEDRSAGMIAVNPVLDECSSRGLEASTGVSKSEVNASINRSIAIGMAKLDRKTKTPKANVDALLEFIVHGIKYVFPAKPAAIVRGIATSISAPVLEGKLMSAGEFIYVWPDAEGNDKGQAVKPLYKTVPMAVKKDARLYEFLALVDAIRLGQSRESNFAAKLLEKKLKQFDDKLSENNLKPGNKKMDNLVENYRQQILDLAEANGVKNVRVFGSMARNEANPDSDLDLLVDLEEGSSGFSLGGFLYDVSNLVHRKVDVVTEKSLHPSLREKVLKESNAL